MKRIEIWWMGAILLLVSLAGQGQAQEEPKQLFDVETDKKIEQVFMLNADGREIIFVINEEDLMVHDANSGEEMWTAEIDDYDDDGLDLVWNERQYITSTDDYMLCYNLLTGEIVWKTEQKLKMNDFHSYINFPTGFVLIFDDDMYGFDEKTGEVLWHTEEFGLSGLLYDAGLSNEWSFERSFGDRLVLLGKKQTYVYDARTGELLGTAEVEWDGDLDNRAEDGKPVYEVLAEAGDDLIVLFEEDETTAMNLRDGSVVWTLDQAINPKYGYLTFEAESGSYGLLAGKKGMTTVDLRTGEQLWGWDEETLFRPRWGQMTPGGTLVMVGLQQGVMKKVPVYDRNGSFVSAFGIDPRSGETKWGPVALSYSPGANVLIDIGLLNDMARVNEEPWFMPNGDYLFWGMAQQAKDPYNDYEKGGDGFTRLNPETGEVVYRATFHVWDPYNSEYSKAGGNAQLYPPTQPTMMDDTAYVIADGQVHRVDLNTGEVKWSSPNYEYIHNIYVYDGLVFGPIGLGYWTWAGDVEKKKGVDRMALSKQAGYFALDAETGEVLTHIENKKRDHWHWHLQHYDAESGQVLLANNEYLRAIHLRDGKVTWEQKLKGLTGEVTAEDGVTFKKTGVSSSYSGGYYSYTISTTTYYDVNFGFGVEWIGDGILVMADDGPAKVNPDGSVAWTTDWKWSNDDIYLIPAVVSDGKGLIYQYKKQLKYISLADGSTVWTSKERKKTDYQLSEDGTRLYAIGKNEIAAFKL